MKSIVVCLLLLFSCICDAQTNNFSHDDDVVEKARILLGSRNKESNEKGEAILQEMTGVSIEARFLLGWWILNNKHGDWAKKRALSLIMSASQEKNINASYLMMDVYRENKYGFGIKNPEKATKLLKRVLIEIKEPLADDESTLGKWLLEDNPKKNKKEAIFWLEKAVEHGNTFALMSLAPLFVDGEEQDLVKAWFYSDLGGTGMASEKHAIEKQMTPEQREQAQEMSWQWQDEHHIHVPGYRGQGSPLRWQVESH